MKVEITVPEVGESISEGLLAAWSAENGSPVIEGQALFELETDKTTIDVTAPATGTLAIEIPAGSDVSIGAVVGHIDTDGAAAAGTDPPPPSEESAEPAGAAPPADDGRTAPAARAAASAAGIEQAALDGSGRLGTVTKADVRAAAGRDAPSATETGLPAADVPKPEPPAADAAKPIEVRKPMSRIRRAIAANLARTRDEMVLLTTFNEADMSAIKAMRSQYGSAFQDRHGVKLGFMSLFLKASAAALAQFPEVNACINDSGDEIIYRNSINISVAVSTPRGLLTPVVRSVETKNFAAIEAEILSFAQKAADKTLLPDDLIGGTFTITNGGIFGSMMSTPLPAPGQSAILGMHSIQDRPVARNGTIEIRPMMYLALSYDHRLIDGREAVGCLKMIKDEVEDPRRLLLEL